MFREMDAKNIAEYVNLLQAENTVMKSEMAKLKCSNEQLMEHGLNQAGTKRMLEEIHEMVKRQNTNLDPNPFMSDECDTSKTLSEGSAEAPSLFMSKSGVLGVPVSARGAFHNRGTPILTPAHFSPTTTPTNYISPVVSTSGNIIHTDTEKSTKGDAGNKKASTVKPVAKIATAAVAAKPAATAPVVTKPAATAPVVTKPAATAPVVKSTKAVVPKTDVKKKVQETPVPVVEPVPSEVEEEMEEQAEEEVEEQADEEEEEQVDEEVEEPVEEVEEEDGEQLEETVIKGISYYVHIDRQNTPIYAKLFDDEIGDVVGNYVDGYPILFAVTAAGKRKIIINR